MKVAESTLHNQSTTTSTLDAPITKSEFDQAVKQLKTNKTAGPNDETTVPTIKTFKQSTKNFVKATTNNRNSIINRPSNVIFTNTIGIVRSDTPSIGIKEIGAISIVNLRDGNIVQQLQYNRFTPGQGLNNERVNRAEWANTMMKLLPQHHQFHTPKDACLQNGIFNMLNNIINHFYLNGMFEGDRRRFGRELAAFTLLTFGRQAHDKTIISAAYNVEDKLENEKHYTNIIYTGQGVLNILFVMLETGVINSTIVGRLPSAFQQIFNAVQKQKIGVTSVYDVPYNGDELPHILMHNLRMAQDTPINVTFESCMCTWANDFLVNYMTTTDDTGIENGIFAAYGIPSAMFGMDGILG